MDCAQQAIPVLFESAVWAQYMWYNCRNTYVLFQYILISLEADTDIILRDLKKDCLKKHLSLSFVTFTWKKTAPIQQLGAFM